MTYVKQENDFICVSLTFVHILAFENNDLFSKKYIC